MPSQPPTFTQPLPPTGSVNMPMTLTRYLLVPAKNSLSLPQGIQHVSDWATASNLKLNYSKSQEMIVHLPRRKTHFPYPTAIPGIKRVDKMNVLGITISDTLTFHHHISVLIAKSARSFYALKTIRTHGLNGNALWDVTHAALVLQLLYASPAWWGYLKADERNRLQSVIKKAKWYSYAFVMSVKLPVLTYLQHFCQNLLKLVDVCQSYSKPKVCCF